MALDRVRAIVRALAGRARLDREIGSELQSHVDARRDDLIAQGLDPATAAHQALRELGDIRRWKEEGREARGLRWVDHLVGDVRYAARGLHRSPGFALTAILSIAIGIGANATIFSLVDAVLLRQAPVRDPGSLVILGRSDDAHRLGSTFPYLFYRSLQETTSLQGVLCLGELAANVEAAGVTERLSIELVSGTFFPVLGIQPAVGRLFTPADDDVRGGHPLAVLSYRYWQRRFGGHHVIGETLRVNGVPLTIVGVTPEAFTGLQLGASPDVRIPMAMQPRVMAQSRLDDPAQWWLSIIGRLRPGVGRAAADAEIRASFDRYSEANQFVTPRPRHAFLIDGSRGRPAVQQRLAVPLTVMSALAGAVLLLICANVANLLLVRNTARQQEFAVRVALGATRARVIGQLAMEALLIAALGAAFGVIAAAPTARFLARMATPLTGATLEPVVDLRVAAVASLLALITGVASALMPSLVAVRRRLTTTLGAGRRSVRGGRVQGRALLVSAQIALSVALLVGAGLFARTLVNLRTVDLGIDPDRLLLLRLDPTLASYTRPQLHLFYRDLTTRVAAVPGIESASAAAIPLIGRNDWSSGITLDTLAKDNDPGPERNAVTPGYFATIGMAVVAGREFEPADVESAPRVAVVNETFARRYFGGQALGRRIGSGFAAGPPDHTIVGVVRDGKYADTREGPQAMWYVPYEQLGPLGNSDTATRISQGMLTLYVRTEADPEASIAAVLQAVRDTDNRVAVSAVRTMPDQIASQLVIERVLAMLAGAFAVVATLLAALGLYGVTAYTAAARTREVGVRLALGATPRAILVMMLRQTSVLIALGLGAGLLLTFGLVRFTRNLLFGLRPTDPVVLVGTLAVITLVTLAAAWVPARRASRLDPTRALQ